MFQLVRLQYRIIGLGVVVVILLYSFAFYRPNRLGLCSDVPCPWFKQEHVAAHKIEAKLSHTQNETLGFQEVYLISMPSRTDKQDARTVQAALTGFRLRISDGVDGTQVSPKALPYTMDVKATVLGCWRAHLDVFHDMVARGIESALIFEDDVDWDVSIKSQLKQFARGSQYILGPGPGDMHSPYGDGWDMLWLGHCSTLEDLQNNRRWVIPNDPTVVPYGERHGMDVPDMSSWDNKTRIVFAAKGGCCMTSYAMSLAGAEKALYHFSMIPYNGPVDWAFSDACRDRKSGFTCIAPYPPLMGIYRPAGNSSKFSDIETEGAARGQIVTEGFTSNLVFSARMNADRLLTHQTSFKSEFPEVSGAELMAFEDIAGAIGHPEVMQDNGTSTPP